jgi:hypothetical protein
MSAGGSGPTGEGSSRPIATDALLHRPAPSGDDVTDALTILARELYWAGGPISRSPIDTGSLRERLHGFAQRMRIEALERYPSSEPGLDRARRLRRRTKRGLWYVFRFATLRYDRLLGELAELNVQLAERLAETERALERLRGDGSDEPDAG